VIRFQGRDSHPAVLDRLHRWQSDLSDLPGAHMGEFGAEGSIALFNPAGRGAPQRPDRRTVVEAQRTAGVKPHPGVAGDSRIVRKAGVIQRVRHDQHLVFEDRVRAERHIARRLAGHPTRRRLEPLAVMVNKRHQSNRHGERGRRDSREPVKTVLGVRIENLQGAQRCEQARIADAANATTDNKVRVVDPPQLPQVPVAPKRPLLITGVLGLGLAAAIGVIVLFAQFDRSFGNLFQLRRLGIPVLGSLSYVGSQLNWRHWTYTASFAAATVLLFCVYGDLMMRAFGFGSVV